MPELPKKLPAKGISTLFGVSEQRISQLKRSGRLNPDSDNMYSVEEAVKLRGFQMSEHGVRVVAQQYSNGTGQVADAKVTPLDPTAVDGTINVDVTQVAPSPNSVFAQSSRLTGLREEKLRTEIDTRRMQQRKLAGELVERAAVQTSYINAGQLVANILQNLPAEIATIFADPDKKAEVRLKVQTRVDQIQHALYTALKDYGEKDAGGPPDVGSGPGDQAQA